MLAKEKQAVAVGRGRSIDGPWFGIALSGGGIRSATFCLGALQHLASAGLLKHFDYMSSVSGGGYTAASVQWWWQQKPTDYDASLKFPYGCALVSSSKTENSNLKFLRWHASYLAPGGGISIWSGIAVVLRTLLLSLFVWLPAGVAAMLFLHAAGVVLLRPLRPYLPPLETTASKLFILGFEELPAFACLALLAAATLVVLFLAATVFLAIVSIVVPPETRNNRIERVMRATKCIAMVLIIGTPTFFLIGELSEYGGISAAQNDLATNASWLIAYALTAFMGLALVVALLQFVGWLEVGVNYGLRRFFEAGATYLFALLVPLLVLGSLPFIEHALLERVSEKGVLGLSALASGLLAGLYGHFVQAQRIAPRYASRWFATIAAGIFIYSILLISYLTAKYLIDPSGDQQIAYWLRAVAPALLIFSVIFARVSNLNSLGMHRFYRDRLMEAFLPTNPKLYTGAPAYTDADRVPLSEFWPRAGANPVERPYPLINTNAIMIYDSEPKVALRGGDSFILSPLFVGSLSTGWADSVEHGKQHSPLTLASAMAASGAAANANAAYIGSGITRDRLISIVMTLLNMRLGLWFGTPGAKSGTPNYYSPGFKYGVLRAGYKRGSNFVELTDGGHFDNLGVYELTRRRADVILVLDSEEDPSTAMAALASVCQRIQEDFDTTIDIKDKANKIAPTGDLGYPTGAKFTDAPYFIAKIDYPALIDASGQEREKQKTGVFAYVKSNMIPGLSFPARGYKANNPDFPNQSTMDQFFDPAQFEAYRELGYAAVHSLVSKLGLTGAEAAKLQRDLMAAASG